MLVVLVLAVGTLLIAALVTTSGIGDSTGPPTASGLAPLGTKVEERPGGVPSDAEPAIVDRVVDGDTLYVIFGDVGRRSSVRLLNIDTPELANDGRAGECGAEVAAGRLTQLVEPGDPVWLAADRERRDRYDRELRGMWTAEGVFVNEVMAGDGFAEAVLFPPNHRFHAEVEAAVREARSAHRGLWDGSCFG